MIELLVVISIIALLIGILLPALGAARDTARKMRCLSGMRQIGIAGFTHATDDRKGVVIRTFTQSDDSLAHLFSSSYLQSPEIGICPSTTNTIDQENLTLTGVDKSVAGGGDFSQWNYEREVIADLTHSAPKGTSDDTGGHSYEIFAWMTGVAVYPNGKQVNGFRAGTYREQRGRTSAADGVENVKNGNKYVLKTLDNVTTASTVLLVLDADDRINGQGTNNFPDEDNNHGEDGLNISFLDGHASWVSAGPDLLETYLNGYSKGVTNAVYAEFLPSFVESTVNIGGFQYRKFTY